MFMQIHSACSMFVHDSFLHVFLNLKNNVRIYVWTLCVCVYTYIYTRMYTYKFTYTCLNFLKNSFQINYQWKKSSQCTHTSKNAQKCMLLFVILCFCLCLLFIYFLCFAIFDYFFLDFCFLISSFYLFMFVFCLFSLLLYFIFCDFRDRYVNLFILLVK